MAEEGILGANQRRRVLFEAALLFKVLEVSEVLHYFGSGFLRSGALVAAGPSLVFFLGSIIEVELRILMWLIVVLGRSDFAVRLLDGLRRLEELQNLLLRALVFVYLGGAAGPDRQIVRLARGDRK